MPMVRDNFDVLSTELLPGSKPYIEAMIRAFNLVLLMYLLTLSLAQGR